MPPEKKWPLEEKCLRLEYKFEFMPRGIVNQLSAELSRFIRAKEVWNNAVNLVYEGGESQIIEDSYNRKLSITSKGVDARALNVLIMNSIRNIIEEYEGVKEKMEIHVKCSCKKCRQLEDSEKFRYDKLLEWSKQRNSVTCNESGESLSISELLYNVGFFNESGIQPSIKTITIFLASSQELKDDRDEFEIFINRENKELINQGIFLRLERWEDFLDAMSQTRLQDEYNKAVISSDIFVSLFWTKAGDFTKEEFYKAFGQFKENKKPFVYTYFKKELVDPDNIQQSLLDFKQELKNLGHFRTNYKNIDNLKYQFKMQLPDLIEQLKKH